MRDIINQLKESLANKHPTMLSDNEGSAEELEMIGLINEVIDRAQKEKKHSMSYKSRLLSDIDILADALGKISLGNFDTVIPSMRVPEMDTVGIGIVDMEAKLKEGAIAQQEKEEAIRELKILSGLIPICASCKKIRDNKGSWKQLEIYIQDHSEAMFSHSVCQQCAKVLYPDLVDESGNFVDQI